MESAPPEFAAALRRQADVTNLPQVGFDGNYAFPTFQANFAATQEADEDARKYSQTIEAVQSVQTLMISSQSLGCKLTSVRSVANTSTSMTAKAESRP